MKQVPQKIWLFRMVHRDNLAYLLEHGLHAHNPNFVSIGDSTLITSRQDYSVPITPPNGKMGDYIPFYFGFRSPMLYRIKTGKSVVQQPQENIVYLCYALDDMVGNSIEWCFTDGHAKRRTTQFFNDLKDLDKVDWEAVYATEWKDTQDHPDRMRRKQAEFLVKGNLFANSISYIVVFNENAKLFVENILNVLSLQITVRVNKQETKNDFYY